MTFHVKHSARLLTILNKISLKSAIIPVLAGFALNLSAQTCEPGEYHCGKVCIDAWPTQVDDDGDGIGDSPLDPARIAGVAFVTWEDKNKNPNSPTPEQMSWSVYPNKCGWFRRDVSVCATVSLVDSNNSPWSNCVRVQPGKITNLVWN